MVKESKLIRMESLMLEILWIISEKDKVSILMKMEIGMKVSGEVIFIMAKEKNTVKMAQFSKVPGSKMRSMEKEF